jgi:hypothetical protein
MHPVISAAHPAKNAFLTVDIRVRLEIMGKSENVGKSQSVLIVIHPIIFTRTRTCWVITVE